MHDSSAGPSEGPKTEASMVADLFEKILKDHPSLAPPEHLKTKLDSTWNTFMMSPDKGKSISQTMLAIMEECNPETGTRNDGITAFFDFNRKLTHAEAVKVVQEVTTLYDDAGLANIDPGVVLAVHETLCLTADDVDQGHEQLNDNELKVGDRLYKNFLGIFLYYCSEFIPYPDINKDRILEEVKKLTRCEDDKEMWDELLPNVGSIVASPSVSTTSVNQILLWALMSYMEVSAAHAEKAKEVVPGQYGHPRHVGMHHLVNQLLEKLGNDVDVAKVTSLLEQVDPHALQYATDALPRAQFDKDMATLTDELVEAKLWK
ncbi:hypothetical protein ACHAP8_004023 [Fusarium lateritium]